MRAEALIAETLKLEEDALPRARWRAASTLLDEETAGLSKGDVLDGETAFTLYDTYGFPLDLTQDALRARGIAVDLAGFDDGDGAPAREGARLAGPAPATRRRRRYGSRCAKSSAPPNSLATKPRAPKAWCWRC